MSGQLVAEYSAADHLVVFSEGRISIWRRRAAEAKAEELRPARKRILVREPEQDDGSLKRRIEANATRKAEEAEAAAAKAREAAAEDAARHARLMARYAEVKKSIAPRQPARSA